MARADTYTMNLLKVNAACCLHNYRQTHRAAYLSQAIAYTCEALRLHAKAR